MFDFEDNAAFGEEPEKGRGADNQTDRVNGEYHYKNGYTQKIYSDAHYVHEDENTVPPRYYTPPEKTVREPKPPKLVTMGLSKLIAACVGCAVLGGALSAAVVGSRVDARIDSFAQEISALHEEVQNTQKTQELAAAAAAEEGGISPAVIYDDACNEVVNIKTEVTYTSFFGRQISSTGTGSGFVVSSDGYIVTNNHVVASAYNMHIPVQVTLNDGTVYSAAVVGVDESDDIAVLKIEAEDLKPAVIGDSEKLLVGDTVYAVGNPLSGLEYSMTVGHVSALDREISSGENTETIRMFQIDAPVNSGNSGGPVYNNRGEVVGIVTAKYSDTGVEGLGFAIPISEAYSKINDIVTKGYVTGRASIGISVDARYNAVYSQYYGMPMGAYVASVESGSCAEKAGLQPGDIITKINDIDVTGFNDLPRALKRFSAGDNANLYVYRAGEITEIPVVFDEARPH